LPDRFAGAGVRDAEPFEIADAIDGRTAMIHWVAGPAARPSLDEVVAVADRAGLPVLVDAAAELPPATNLRRFIESGADLVVFSGGKALGGPQASGILAGRRDLIMAAALQQLDLDIALAQWRPPADFIDLSQLAGLPQHGIGRPCKVGKEEVVGLLVALERFLADDPAARRAAWRDRLLEIRHGLLGRRGLEVVLRDEGEVPLLALEIDEQRLGRTAFDLLLALEAGEPSIRPYSSEIHDRRLLINPLALRGGEPGAIVDAVIRLLETSS
ncbi:MAG: hypothetical protein R3349_01305, partial [Geminicoccaceae bacterium]|nr:hypothetical protein [Geminicoccaceae bacterium]